MSIHVSRSDARAEGTVFHIGHEDYVGCCNECGRTISASCADNCVDSLLDHLAVHELEGLES